MKRSIITFFEILFVIVLATFFALNKNQIISYVANFKQENLVCPIPFSYSIGDVDSKFGITKEEFSNSVKQATKDWEEKTGYNLFVEGMESPHITVSLKYDDRQAQTNLLKKTQAKISVEKEAISEIHGDYDSLKTQYDAKVKSYNSKLSAYNSRVKAYEAKVKDINAKGGATTEEFNSLKQELASLENDSTTLESERTALNSLVDQVNKQAKNLQSNVSKVNKEISDLNNATKDIQDEFEQGLFVYDGMTRTIDIYQFENITSLVGVLTHEFGHALSLQHTTNPKSIMYYLHDENTKQQIGNEDIALVKQHCQNNFKNSIARSIEEVRDRFLNIKK